MEASVYQTLYGVYSIIFFIIWSIQKDTVRRAIESPFVPVKDKVIVFCFLKKCPLDSNFLLIAMICY